MSDGVWVTDQTGDRSPQTEAHDAARRCLSEFGGPVTFGWPADSITTSSAIRFDDDLAEQAGVDLYPHRHA
ncbi:hypothetical protein C9J60_14935 [Streptomyces sp. A244]|nr:hypothetical protein C9J60_14935 [Streptomyces sp. A244]